MQVDPPEITPEVHFHCFQLPICPVYKVPEADSYRQLRGYRLKVDFQKMRTYFLRYRQMERTQYEAENQIGILWNLGSNMSSMSRRMKMTTKTVGVSVESLMSLGVHLAVRRLVPRCKK